MLCEFDAIERESGQQESSVVDVPAPATDADPGERFAWLVGR